MTGLFVPPFDHEHDHRDETHAGICNNDFLLRGLVFITRQSSPIQTLGQGVMSPCLDRTFGTF